MTARSGSGVPASASATRRRPRCSRSRAKRRSSGCSVSVDAGQGRAACSQGDLALERRAASPAAAGGRRRRSACCAGSTSSTPPASTPTGAHGGYEALRRGARIWDRKAVIREVTDAKLMGRGGAAFPTGRKWDAVARQPVRPHYLICNADESEPGTFKDRVIMEGDPFGVVEAMTIAAFATGCEQGFIYIRGEYPLAAERLQHAIDAARARGLLGDDIMGHGFAFDIEIRKGGGAYICGEETAIFNSIEGFRGEPRNKPPFPVQSGVFGKPTVINNVETLVNVLEILRIGGPAYARIGTEDSTGPRLFCLSGCVARPGVYEVPFGATLRQMLELAGGVAGGPAAAGDPARRRGRGVRPRRRARHAAHLRGRPRGAGARSGSGRHHGVRRHGGHAATSCCGSRRSSATSRAASACPAGSARCARRRRCTGSSSERRAAGSAASWRCWRRSAWR